MTDVNPTRTSARLPWMDAVRGTAIVLLLVWHASAVPDLLGEAMPESIRTANAFFMPFRMPTLMLLSGMLLSRSLRKPLPEYYAGKFAQIAWPYVLWVLIAKVVFLDIVGLPWWHWRAWYATSYLWFLFFIGCYYLIAPAVRRLPSWLTVAVPFALAVLLPHAAMEQRLAYFAVFFFAGHLLATHDDLLQTLLSGRKPLIWALAAASLGVSSMLHTDTLQYNPWCAPLSICGTLAVIAAFSRWHRSGPVSSGLAFVGRSSIVYYVSHFPAMVIVTRPILSSAEPWLLALVNLAAATVVGTALALMKNRLPWQWLFQAPAPLTRAVAAALRRVRLPGADARR